MKQFLPYLLTIYLILFLFSSPLFAQDRFAKDFNLFLGKVNFIKTLEGPPYRTDGENTYGIVIGFVYKINLKIIIKNLSAINKSLNIIFKTPDGIEHFCEFNSEKKKLELNQFYNFSFEIKTKYKGNAQILTSDEDISVYLK
jgi:hypothetical protein